MRYHRRTRSTAVRILLAKERHDSGVTFDFLSASFRADPYPSYRRLQAQDPVHWSEFARGWVCTDPAHLEAAFQDARLSSNRFRVQGFNDLLDAVGAGRLASRSIMAGVVGQDPPAHASARSRVAAPFSSARADALRPRIDRIAERLLDDADRGRQPGQPLDLVAALADPLPTRVIAEILGLPADDHLQLKRWSDDMYAITDAVTNPAILARSDRAFAAFAAFDAYLRRQIAARWDHPTPDHQPSEDVLTSLVDAQRAGQISHETLVGDMGFILSAGREGAACLIANALLALLQHPQQLAHARATPSAIPGVVDETIRYNAPVQFTSRVATEDMQIGERRIKSGQLVILALGAANRSPSLNDHPDRFDIQRRGIRHLGLGLGTHHCLGAFVAEHEAGAAIAAVLQRWPHLRLAEPPTWRASLTVRGPVQLRVHTEPPV